MIGDFPHGTGVKLEKLAGCGKGIIFDAILVYRYARELVDEVIAGVNPDITLADAVRIAKRVRVGIQLGDGKIWIWKPEEIV